MLSVTDTPQPNELLPIPAFIPIRYKPGNLGTWSGHLTFANDLIAAVRPALLVELGTHWGESYFTFCQSIFQNRLDCLCYAVDHWLGEPHAGFYGEEVFHGVEQVNDSLYRGFSYLLRMSFDEAVMQFADDSIDLLHIDGLHTYEAVTHDFRTWLPKVKPGGLVLLHDIAVRHADFGVWRLWEEVKEEFHNTFSFYHSWGLGILQKPGGNDVQPGFLDLLFRGSSASFEKLRRHYVMCAAYLESTRTKGQQSIPIQSQIQTEAAERVEAHIQLYWHGPSGNYAEEESIRQSLPLDRWIQVLFNLPRGTGEGPLRVDPADCISVIDIRSLILRDEVTGVVLFAAEEPLDFEGIQVAECALQIPGEAACSLLSLSDDPYLILPSQWQSKGPVQLELSVRAQTTPAALASAFQTQLASATARIQQEAQREIRILQELLDAAEEQTRDHSPKGVLSPAGDIELRSTRELLEEERAMRMAMQQSRSWTLTRPLRSLTSALKARR